ncbi:MAG: 4-hydroxy-tetrahydrodipicolinate synthase [Reyranellaceae bacterium]
MRIQSLELRGAIAALPTPMWRGAIDVIALEALCHRLIERGVSGLVPCGTTGEAPLLSAEEHQRVVATAVLASGGRVPVVAGAGGCNTAVAVELAKMARDVGASGLLCVTPYYLRPTQAGIIAHISAIHDAVALPIVLYDVPSRTACALADETVERLAELPRVVALKDATADISRVGRLRARVGGKLALLSGDDATQASFRTAGGDGCISVTANVAPALCATLHRACDERDTDEVTRLARILAPLHAALFVESNPIPLKRALNCLSLAADDLRLPLTPLSPAGDATLRAAMALVMSEEEDEAGRRDLLRRASLHRAA